MIWAVLMLASCAAPKVGRPSPEVYGAAQLASVASAGISADGQTIAFLDQSEHLVVINRRARSTHTWDVPRSGMWTVDGAPVRPSPDGRWIAVGTRELFFDTSNGAFVRSLPPSYFVDSTAGSWTRNGCYAGFWFDESTSGVTGYCPSVTGFTPTNHVFSVRGTVLRLPIAVSPLGDQVAFAEAFHRVVTFSAGPRAKEQGANEDPVPNIVGARSEDLVVDVGYDPNGRLVTLTCRGTGSCRRTIDGGVSLLAPDAAVALSANGLLALALTSDRAALYDAELNLVAAVPLLGDVQLAVTADAAAALFLQDGRIQLLK